MIKKTLATVVMVSSLVLSNSVMAASLHDDMGTLGKNFKAFNQASTPQAATSALNNMRSAAVHAKQYKLTAHMAEKAPSSTALFDQIIVEIDKTKALVQAGKLDEAKKQGKKIAELRDQGHKAYMHH
jgi:soluble cytochrome b562